MNLFVTSNLGSLTDYPHTIHKLNQHDPASALVCNSVALIACSEIPEQRIKLQMHNWKGFQFNDVIKAKMQKLKLKLSKAICKN